MFDLVNSWRSTLQRNYLVYFIGASSFYKQKFMYSYILQHYYAVALD